MKHKYYEAMRIRRSIYALSKESTVSDDRIKKVVAHSLNHTPTAFNSQSGRVVTLLGDHHDELWNIAETKLRKIVPEDDFAETKARLDGFRGAYGTLVFFEDQDVVKSLQEKFPLYKDHFPVWSQQAAGILQNNIWTSFAVEGLGASLQHYTELIEEEVKNRWEIPSNWKMVAQMPFGKPVADPGEKQVLDAEEKHLVHQ